MYENVHGIQDNRDIPDIVAYSPSILVRESKIRFLLLLFDGTFITRQIRRWVPLSNQPYLSWESKIHEIERFIF